MRYATLKLIMSFRPRYTESEIIAAMNGKKRLTPRQYAALEIPPKDRLWGMFRVWPEFVSTTLDLAVERAIRRSLGKSGCAKWERWANSWLDRTNRSADAADAARAADAAGAAAYAARAAGAAADAAAGAAAYAARAARAAADAAAGAAYAAAGAAADAAAYAAAYADELEQIITDFVNIAEGRDNG